jgi:hypothetical protein
MAGAAASKNGSRHPYRGPTNPLIICPIAIPAPVLIVRKLAT